MTATLPLGLKARGVPSKQGKLQAAPGLVPNAEHLPSKKLWGGTAPGSAAQPVSYPLQENAKTEVPLNKTLTRFFFGSSPIIEASVLNYNAVPTLSKPKHIGHVSTDSGTFCIVDPCHIEVSKSGSVRFPRVNLYTAVDTELGDGEFTVHEQRDSRGRLRRIVIEIDQ